MSAVQNTVDGTASSANIPGPESAVDGSAETMTPPLQGRGGRARGGTAIREEWEQEERIASSSAANRAGPPLHGMSIYEGECLGDNDVYVGQCLEGERHGEGKYTFADGNVYEGGWLKGEKHGQGRYTFIANGDVYEGQWLNDEMHGQGKYTYASGGVYEGGWKEDKKHGKGTLTWADGSVYDGQWLNDEKDGQGKLTYADEAVYEGQWLDSKRHGEGKLTDLNADVYEGQWLNDVYVSNGSIQITLVNRDTKMKAKNIYSSDTTLGCFLKESTKDLPHSKYFRVVHMKKTRFLSSSGKKSLRSLGIKDGDEVEIGGVFPSENNGSSDSPKKAKKASKSKPKRQKKPRGTKKPASPSSHVVSDKELGEQHKREHSKSMNPVLEEMGPRLKKIRNQLNSLTLRKAAPKEKCHNAKSKDTPQVASAFQLDLCHAKKAGKVIYPILVGEGSNLYKTSRSSHRYLSPIDLHGCSKGEALEKLGDSLPVWVEAAMRGNHPWVLGVDILCGGGNQTLSDVVKEWIRANEQVANRPKGVL